MLRCAIAVLTAALLALAMPAAAQQVQRSFPGNALRGELAVVQPPEIVLNGKPARLAPGSRIRGTDNLLVMSASLVGAPALLVHYTIDDLGHVRDVWLLRDDEAAKLWPKTAAEAARWAFDPVAQLWSKR